MSQSVGQFPYIPDLAGSILPGHLGDNMRVGFIPLPLSAWRLIATNEIPAIAVASGNGGQLASDTAPKLARLNAATDKNLAITWVAAGVIEITQGFLYPPDLDDTQNVVFHFLARMGGASDTPVVGVNYFEGIGDTNAGGNSAAVTGTTLTEYTVTIPASDVGAFPKSAAIGLIPAAHATDTLEILATWVTYTRKP